MHRLTPGSCAGVALALIIAALPSLLLPRWLPAVLFVSGLLAAAIAVGLLIEQKRDRRRRGELRALLERIAAVGGEVVELRRGPTFDAWRRHSERLLAAAIGESAAAEALGPPVAGVVVEMDPMEVLAGYPFGWDYVRNLQAIAAQTDDIPLMRSFSPSAWAVFDPGRWEQEHARAIAWEPQNGAPCPWCGQRIYPTSGTCGKCGAQVGAELAFR